MKIDGKIIAEDLLINLSGKVIELKKRSIVPHLVIILVGDDPASASYVRQKKLKAEAIGAKETTYQFPANVNPGEIFLLTSKLNNDPSVHGVIIQRPLPQQLSEKLIDSAIDPKKDIDAFHPQTHFEMPLAKAVVILLKHIFAQNNHKEMFEAWLQKKQIVVMGKGKTGGGPTIDLLGKMGLNPLVVDSKTADPEKLTKTADIIITAVGKRGIITNEMIKSGVILINMGMHKEDGKLHGDYEEEDIKDKASFYTPTPGGVGPVNVACLLENLTKAVELV
ncbi:MAG: bifunctional methylenetetrahydrofolate dehydrogenase/methenyltetrahydrofolate cyclohydrolase [Candidatus Levybacteria bacterium]|nr:bifunctional methylenetetrahydrofolate dehydrogenase/methenyltetrahydrofolate cyclohydrolase [Candidatus Levybacteria bacterium]